MEINCKSLKWSLSLLNSKLKNKDRVLNSFLKIEKFGESDIDQIYEYLSEKILDANYTKLVKSCFEPTILLIIRSAIKISENDDFPLYQIKCIALSKLIENSKEILEYATKYFANKPPPFQPAIINTNSKKKRIKLDQSNALELELEIVKCCYNLLLSDLSFFKNLWNWSDFLKLYMKKGRSIQQLYSNHIAAKLTNMSQLQLNQLNANISEDIHIQFHEETNSMKSDSIVNVDLQNDTNDETIIWNFKSEVVNIEGVFLPINKHMNNEYKEINENHDQIVKVESTRINLRNIALAVSSGKAICLSGPVGCGKTTLIEYLAKKTGRKYSKIHRRDDNMSLNVEETERSNSKNNQGFLNIQLGHQTDSKLLLGQYHCTDVPGEFLWLPGVLTEAVMKGYWLLLEDIDLATQDTFTLLNNFLENKSLDVPGFRNGIKVESGFQLFVTMRTNQPNNSSQKSLMPLLEKYLFMINILPLSYQELTDIVSINYPKLKTISNRIVDVYLSLSSGKHLFVENDLNQIKDNKQANLEEINTVSSVNSGRLVSTRDLIKLCQRSHPKFSITSSECAYFVFENAVDVFCSYQPNSPEKTQLIRNIGAKLGITESRCDYYANDYKPEITFGNNVINIGRAKLTCKLKSEMKRTTMDCDDIDELCGNKKIKLNENSDKIIQSKSIKKPLTTFSFTRITICLLERIAVCLLQNEPVLLVGETGVGKTSSVQYLAQMTKHKLITVNMSNQSDVSDLIGGFKPVDLGYVVTGLRSEFEYLFRQTFNESKNEKFLKNLSILYNQENFSIIIKLMIKIVATVFEKTGNNLIVGKNREKLLNKWQVLQKKLLKLSSQLKKNFNISFSFIPGSLVNSIKNGDWLLLDEINLASSETLECLSSILEPDGSIVLIERGDFTPIKRHPNFRIFGCMNPSTDIGKKDLPIGIRNRFTEFFVDELSAENDLMILIHDYLSSTGLKKNMTLKIVKLYNTLKKMSKLELNDGLGNHPIFSLRTLCRSLMICSKNLCGSIERNLYESFCLSFLTQLDPESQSTVLNLIKTTMLSNEKAILGQSIPSPGNNYISFEGYWIERGSNEINSCDNYILTESVKRNLRYLSRIISIGKLPILLQGPTSVGKTSLIEYVAKKSGNHCLRINNHEHTDLQEYIGTYAADISGKLVFKEGVLVQAMRNGFWIILDELNLASTDILEALNRVLDDNRELYIPETNTVIKAHSNFMLFATQNPPGLYGGRKTLSRAFKNRFVELHFSEIPKEELEIILEKRCHIPKSYSKKMVNCMSELQINRKTATKNNFTLRDLFRWGNRYTYADTKLLQNDKYDWNQHLVDEGYLILSSKVRTDVEIAIIEEALYKNFRKKIDISNLYTLNDKTSLVTKDILESILNYKNQDHIIWTQSIIRMAVLSAKALQFNEPILLIGPTGCGKTTICQILADIKKIPLRILNCHMHTEGADFLGGLRPSRNTENSNENESTIKKHLFEWVDGPLILSMQNGSYFMADEISLAEDSVLERLNSVLEPDRTILLAEKGDISNNVNVKTSQNISKELIIQAHPNFKFLATMNPGGDFGKKELSPALRNRFTEIWCEKCDNKNDLIAISSNFLKNFKTGFEIEEHLIATVMINILFYMKNTVDNFKYTVRDILAWSDYLIQNSNNSYLNLPVTLIFGLEIIFLDSFEMFLQESKVCEIRNDILEFAFNELKKRLQITITENDLKISRGRKVESYDILFGIKPFFFESTKNSNKKTDISFFNAPTTKNNLFRLLSALSLQKAVLLEGPPGVGKTSIVEKLAEAIGYKIVRINLCEHTDLVDLFGTDLPAERKSLMLNSEEQFDKNESENLNSFVWHDGPLLAALKAEETWILLDELNLAPQSVLEGLNAILDHRGEVFIPELNKTFKLGKNTRIFTCQNPLKQGGGRKGLPQSFLNRFTKVYLSKLKTEDMLFVINGQYSDAFKNIQNYFVEFFKYIEIENYQNEFDIFDTLNKMDSLRECSNAHNHQYDFTFNLAERMVRFSQALDKGITDLKFGWRGGPFEVNLRDVLRWCDLCTNDDTGFIMKKYVEKNNNLSSLKKSFKSFLLILYERMKLVYHERSRTDEDGAFIEIEFSNAFCCDSEDFFGLSEDTSLYWTDSAIYLNDIVLNRNILHNNFSKNNSSLLLTSQRKILKNLIECVHIEKPVILCGTTDCGKTKLIDVLCKVSNNICTTDNIDDSVTGSFQQVDLNRHLEEISEQIEFIVLKIVQQLILNYKPEVIPVLDSIMTSWNNYLNVNRLGNNEYNPNVVSTELIIFRNRLQCLNEVIEILKKIDYCENYLTNINDIENVVKAINLIVKNADSLNTGGHFEWVDSKIVKSIKNGNYLSLEHVNLCSSAVLDRLNSVFEPNGKLLISEKGIYSGEEAEVVEKHKNFRAFLSLDPKNGELSRAMRNRCIEFYMHDSYTFHDLKMIIFKNGPQEMYLVNAIFNIHLSIKDLRSNSSISNLVHFSSLVSSYKRIGYTDEKAIKVSGFEVYVYSCNTDYSGIGLDNLKNKLKEIIVKYSKNLIREKSFYNFQNIIVTAENLNKTSMIKLQCEPIVMLLNSLNNDEIAKKCFSDMFSESVIDFKNDVNFLKFYTYMIYEASAIDDVKYRQKYLEKIFKDSSTLNEYERNEIISLNETFFEIVINENYHRKNTLKHLPWNTRLFNRLREYRENAEITLSNELQLSLLLIYTFLVKNIEEEKNFKLSMVTPIGYSQGICTKKISNLTNNIFLQYLSPFLTSLRTTLSATLAKSKFDEFIYVDTILSFLWFNRFYLYSKSNKLFVDKHLNVKTMNKLLLHFKWVNKNLLKRLRILSPNYDELISDFKSCLQKIKNYSLSTDHPMNFIQKMYCKKFTHYQPLNSEKQINLNECRKAIENLVQIPPHVGDIEVNELLKKYTILFSENAIKTKSIISTENSLNFLKQIYTDYTEDNKSVNSSSKDSLETTIRNFRIMECGADKLKYDVDFNELSKQIELINADLNNKTSIVKYSELTEIEIFALKDYFLSKNISSQAFCKSLQNINKQYYESILTLKCSDLELLNILGSDDFKNFRDMWLQAIKSISDSKNTNEFTEILNRFTSVEYKNYSSSYRIIIDYVQSYLLSSISYRNEYCLRLCDQKDKISCEYKYNGPALAYTMLSLICQRNGQFLSIPLKDMNTWKNSLNNITQIFWNNSCFPKQQKTSNCHMQLALSCSRKLLNEIEYIQNLNSKKQNQCFMEFNASFEKLITKLKSYNTDIPTMNFVEVQKQTAFIYALMGAIELCLLTFTPLIDPTEKRRLKREYIIEDINCLSNFSHVYKFMKNVMYYNNFGSEIYSKFQDQIISLELKKEKYSQGVAIRSENQTYEEFIKEIKHFIITNCNPQSLLDLITLIENCLNLSEDIPKNLNRTSENIKCINVWIANSQIFINHILSKYTIYFRDFVQPLECSIRMTTFGFELLKIFLIQMENSYISDAKKKLVNVNKNDNLLNLLKNIGNFPSQDNLQTISKNSCNLLPTLNESNNLQFALLRVKLFEIKNKTIISSEMKNETLSELISLLNEINVIWKETEQRKLEKLTEEESLYVNKVRCKELNDDEIELLEVNDKFPTHMNEDFGEFLIEDNLEKTECKTTNPAKVDFDNLNFQFVGENFIFIIEKFCKNNYNCPISSQSHDFDFINPFKERFEMFVNLFHQYKFGLNESINEEMFSTFGFIVGLQLEHINELSLQNSVHKTYDFYKDSNISEIIMCVEVLDKIETKTQEQLNLYPDHATLNDIIQVINTIKNLPSTSSVVRFHIGFQILHKKISMWNEVAHSKNHMRDLELLVAEYVNKWTKLELTSWRNCLTSAYERIESTAFKYWFFIYNLLNDYLEEDSTQSKDIIKMLQQFIESSNYGDFNTRMKLLKAFELYLYCFHCDKKEMKKQNLISVLHNLYIYYNQFRDDVEEFKQNHRMQINKKISDYVKIESYNKDLSYFGTRNNMNRVHRVLNKFIKEYETQLKIRITDIFECKDNFSKEFNMEKNFNSYDDSMIDVKNFIVTTKLKTEFLNLDLNQNDVNTSLMSKLDKLFTTSRIICKRIVSHSQYPKMISHTAKFLDDQIETSHYLRGLEVDRSQERPKQIVQAKNILQQKRKSLSDLFKALTNLGINYKTGLMEYAINSNIIDYEIQPFFVQNMLNMKYVEKFAYLNEKIIHYYAKCNLKLCQLQKLTLKPQDELGPSNIEKMKGFAYDMFIYIQNQRKLLSMSLKEQFDLSNNIKDMKDLFSSAVSNSFDSEKLKFTDLTHEFSCLKSAFFKIRYIFEQFKLLITCLPQNEDLNTIVVENSFRIVKDSEKFMFVWQKTNEILEICKTNTQKLLKFNEMNFLNFNEIFKYREIKDKLILYISQLCEEFKINNDEYAPMCQILLDLLKELNEMFLTNVSTNIESIVQIKTIDVELENIICTLLLSMQNLYKNSVELSKIDETEDNELSQIKYLKKTMLKKLTRDMKLLDITKISKKVTNIMLSLKYTDNLDEQGRSYINKIGNMIPIFEQFNMLSQFYVYQQLEAHRISTKMLSIMLTVFIELNLKGFCMPKDLLNDEEDQKKNDNKTGGGFGFEDGTGEKDISDKIENEDELDEAKKPEDFEKEDKENNEDLKGDDGIDMSENFDGKLHDVDKSENDDENSNDENDEMDKEMGETENDKEKLDEQIWGSGDEQESDDEMNEEDNGKGHDDKGDQHNNLDTNDDINNKDDDNEMQDGLDATNNQNSNKEKKTEAKDIDKMEDENVDEEQQNPYHNELEEPPEAEEMDLDNNFDLNEDNDNHDKNENFENPFDIDNMKEDMEVCDEEKPNKNENDQEENTMDDSEEESEAGYEQKDETNQDDGENTNETEDQSKDEMNNDISEPCENTNDESEIEENNQENDQETQNENIEQSKTDISNEENIQSLPDEKCKGSSDKVENKDDIDKNDMDGQETGDDKDGVGQSDNVQGKDGHQGMANEFTATNNEKNVDTEQKSKDSKKGKSNEERTLAEIEGNKPEHLKTIDKSKESQENDTKDLKNNEEFQHVKEPKGNDRITFDNATEEQSKKIQHAEDDDEMTETLEEENTDITNMDDAADINEEISEKNKELDGEKCDKKSKKPSQFEQSKEEFSETDKIEVEGDNIETMNVKRNNDTTAYCNKDCISSHNQTEETSEAKIKMKILCHNELMNTKPIIPNHQHYDSWEIICNKMLSSARDLCEQLRLILEPTKCTRLKGDYRTGRRINMKKIIPYIASQYRKDKIWLRRTKPAQRDYKITIAIDDSKSMCHNNSKNLTLEAISLVSQALILLESGKLNVLSFGELPQIIFNNERFDGPKLMTTLNFEQNQSRIAELLDFTRVLNSEESTSGGANDIFENLLLILSDGRNIFSEGEQRVKNAIKLAKLQRIFIVYIIIDNPENKHSIIDIRIPNFSEDRKSISMKSYLDMFPFPYYVIVRDLMQLPMVLSEAMRQWFELVHSD